MSRLADFLVIGAMKCGTTSLFHDLASNPTIFLAEKESNHLLHDRVLAAAGRAEYARMFAGAVDNQPCGEVSTAYSKLPDHPGVAERARATCGAGTRIVYLVREPVARIISHHHHDLTLGEMEADIESAIRRRPALVDYSSYAMQITPWIERFGPDQVKIVVFERFIADRRGTVAELVRFLGGEPHDELVEADRVYNPSRAKPAGRGHIWRASRGALYQRLVRPLLPGAARRRLARWLLPVAPPRPEPPTRETVERLLERLADDQERLRQILGEADPVWDRDEVLKRLSPSSAV